MLTQLNARLLTFTTSSHDNMSSNAELIAIDMTLNRLGSCMCFFSDVERVGKAEDCK